MSNDKHELRRRQARGDIVPPASRYVLYVVAIGAPFALVAISETTTEQATAAALAILSAVGPAAALAYDRNTKPPNPEDVPEGYPNREGLDPHE